jgi:hypothetical protein
VFNSPSLDGVLEWGLFWPLGTLVKSLVVFRFGLLVYEREPSRSSSLPKMCDHSLALGKPAI